MDEYTFEVQVAIDPADEGAGWRVVRDPEVVRIDGFTADKVARNAALDYAKVATDPLWRVVVWEGATRGDESSDTPVSPYASLATIASEIVQRESVAEFYSDMLAAGE